MANAPKLDDYVDVAQRIVEFREKHPDGRLRPVDPANPYRVETLGNSTFIVYVAAALRHEGDTMPGIGVAWEPFPGRTPYTKDSELMNAETGAWGRAIMAALAADAKKGIASAQEVRNRSADRDAETSSRPARGSSQGRPARASSAATAAAPQDLGVLVKKIREATAPSELNELWKLVAAIGKLDEAIPVKNDDGSDGEPTTPKKLLYARHSELGLKKSDDGSDADPGTGGGDQ